MFYGFSIGVGGIIVLIALVLLFADPPSSWYGRPHGYAHLRTPATVALPPPSLSMTARSAMAVTE